MIGTNWWKSKMKLEIRIFFQGNAFEMSAKYVLFFFVCFFCLSVVIQDHITVSLMTHPFLDSFEVPLHSPSCRHLPAIRAVYGGCQWPLKNNGNFHWSCEPTMLFDGGNPNLYLDQAVTKGWCQPMRGRVSYPTASSIATRLRLCSSLPNCTSHLSPIQSWPVIGWLSFRATVIDWSNRPKRPHQWLVSQGMITQACIIYHPVSNIRRTLVGNKIVDHWDVVGASPVGAAPTTSSFST